MMDSEDSEFEICTPEEIVEKANVATLNLLPEKSKENYLKEYDTFMKWRNQNNIHSFTERVLLAFFEEKSRKFKSSTLWSSYSKLKATLIINDNVDINKYAKLIAFLKRKSVGYIPKKSNTFSREEINKFLLIAPDDKYLMFKVTLILGIAGGCRREELYKMKIDDIENKGQFLLITIPDSKTHTSRRFTVIGETSKNINLIHFYQNYANLRPKNATTNHFFLSYRNGKCTKQVVGINTFSKIPSLIAQYLSLPHPEEYTGHTFRRTSASLLVDSGGDILQLKQHGGWKSTAVAEGYVNNSLNSKMNCASRILQGPNNSSFFNQPSTSYENQAKTNLTVPNIHNLNDALSMNQTETNVTASKIHISQPNNCVFNIHIAK